MKKNTNTVNQWIFKAEHDYEAMHSLNTNAPALTDSICMHAQQCAEKYIKAYYLSINKLFPFTHDLIKLLNELDNDELLNHDVYKWADDIDTFGILIRYPSINGDPTYQETKLIIDSRENIRRFFRKLLNNYLQQ